MSSPGARFASCRLSQRLAFRLAPTVDLLVGGTPMATPRLIRLAGDLPQAP